MAPRVGKGNREENRNAAMRPAEPPKYERSGIDPKPAREAINPLPLRASRESPILTRASLRAQDWSRGARLPWPLAFWKPPGPHWCVMNVFVTGGAGYIGSVCVEELLEAGHTVTVFDNLSEGHRSAVDPRATFIAGDFSDRTLIDTAIARTKPEAVIHFAAHALVGESMTNPSKYFRNNVASGINLLDACVAHGVRKFVFSSTCATYGIPEKMPMDETLPQRPVNPYGESKLMFERILSWYRELHGLEFVAFRYFNAAGASARFGEHHRIETHLIPNILKVALGQKPQVDIYGTDYPTPDGTCIQIGRAHV